MTFKRKISPSELNCAASGSRYGEDHQKINQLVVEGEGDIDEQTLRQASLKTVEAMPGFRALLQGFWGFKYWGEGGPEPLVKVIEQDWDGTSNMGADFLDTPMDIFKGPLVEILLVKSSKTYVVFRIPHAVTDGMGMIAFMENFFRALRGEPLIESKATMIDMDVLADLEYKKEKLTPARCVTPFGEPRETSHLARDWRRITVKNDIMLLPKVVLALADIARQHGDDEVRFSIPVDLRRHIGDANCTSNLSSTVLMPITEKDTVRIFVKRFNAHLVDHCEAMFYNKIMDRAIWMPFPIWEHLVKSNNKKQSGNPTFLMTGSVSALGNAESAAYSAPGFTALATFGIPLVTYVVPLMVLIWSNENGTAITLGAPTTLTSGQRMDKLVTALQEAL